MRSVDVALIGTDSGDIRCAGAAERPVWRVGYAPEPWAWTPWQFAEDGRFNGRWDDPNGVWRSLYVGGSPLACYLEVLARFRFDPSLQSDLAEIEEDDVDARDHATLSGGVLPRSWCQPRLLGAAHLTGWYAVPGDKESLPTLRARFLPLATRLHLADVDAAAIRLAEPRTFTQQIATWLFYQSGPDDRPLAGVAFESRHGDDLRLWALFERPDDGDVSALLNDYGASAIDDNDPGLMEAMRIHRLSWDT
jgi:hypothetical protein